MTNDPASKKQPLQSVIGVICDALADLSPADQARALTGVAVALGVDLPPVSVPIGRNPEAAVVPDLADIIRRGEWSRPQGAIDLGDIRDGYPNLAALPSCPIGLGGTFA
jgi:hypothetical protein